MTLSFPLTNLMSLCSYTPDGEPWDLKQRQEMSRTAIGRSIAKDMGPGLWVGGFTTQPLSLDDMLDVEAVLNSLDGIVNTFEARDLRRPYPRSSPAGSFGDTGTIYAVQNNKAIRLTGLDAAFVISRGDYLSFDYGGNRYLHQAMETVTAVAGLTPYFEVRPYIKAGLVLSPSIAVKLKQPSAICSLVPNSVQKRMINGVQGTVSFQAMQVLV